VRIQGTSSARVEPAYDRQGGLGEDFWLGKPIPAEFYLLGF